LDSKLGKLVAVHSTSPAFLQRAAIVAALSFLFFLVALIFYLVWQSFLYFVLASGFLIVQVFTMIGWWLQRRNNVRLYENGMTHKKDTVFWADVTGVSLEPSTGLKVELADTGQLTIPTVTEGLSRIAAYIDSKRKAL
jgi:hypothetical protein